MKSDTFFTAAVTIALASACSSEVTFGSDGSGGSGGSDGGGTVGPSAGTDAGSGTGLSGVGGSIDVCGGFDDHQPRETLEILVTNGTTQPLYLPTDCGTVRLDIVGLTGDGSVRYTQERDICVSTCEDQQTDGPIVCGACQQTVIELVPGDTYAVVWDGQGYRNRDMPRSCYASDGFGDLCPQRVNAPLGEAFEVAAIAGDVCRRVDASDAPCSCDDDGECVGAIAGPTHAAEAVASLGVDGEVELTLF
ncbi:MAG: hypothetical protein AAGN82_09490 [Myxococcota bacterium]